MQKYNEQAQTSKIFNGTIDKNKEILGQLKK